MKIHHIVISGYKLTATLSSWRQQRLLLRSGMYLRTIYEYTSIHSSIYMYVHVFEICADVPLCDRIPLRVVTSVNYGFLLEIWLFIIACMVS